MPEKTDFPRPISPQDFPRYAQVATFNRLPLKDYLKLRSGEADIGLLGIPSDGGTVSYRPGARMGPRSIREWSSINRPYLPQWDLDPYSKCKIYDLGDSPINPANVKKSLDLISEACEFIGSKKTRILGVGGDHLVTLGELRGLKKAHKKEVGLIHFDAHTDTVDKTWGESLHHGTWLRRSIEEKLVDPKAIFQIGIRQSLSTKDQAAWDKSMGIRVLGMKELRTPSSRTAFMKNLRAKLAKKPVFLSIDVDAFDPAFAPGTGVPCPGGLTSSEGFDLLREFSGLNILGADIVEVAPMYDPSGITPCLAAHLLMEVLCLMASSY